LAPPRQAHRAWRAQWLAVNTVDFFNEISLLYGTITEFCTVQSCPVMSAGPNFEYLWADNVKIKKPIKGECARRRTRGRASACR
jgi:hypothetical protein